LDLKTQRDYDLIQQCLEGHELAYKSIFDCYAGKMMALCSRYARDTQEGEDWVQEGFIKAFKSLDSFKFSGSFEGWLRKIMVNNCLRNLQKQSRRVNFLELSEFIEPGIDPNIINELEVEQIIKVIEMLPDGYRIVFNLSVIEGYSHKEIAEKLNITESTSRSQLVKAKRALKSKLVKHLRIAV